MNKWINENQRLRKTDLNDVPQASAVVSWKQHRLRQNQLFYRAFDGREIARAFAESRSFAARRFAEKRARIQGFEDRADRWRERINPSDRRESVASPAPDRRGRRPRGFSPSGRERARSDQIRQIDFRTCSLQKIRKFRVLRLSETKGQILNLGDR